MAMYSLFMNILFWGLCKCSDLMFLRRSDASFYFSLNKSIQNTKISMQIHNLNLTNI